MFEALARFRMVALLGTRLLAAAPGTVPDRLRARLEAAVRAAEAVGQGYELATLRVCTELERGAVPVLALKGQLLSRRLYGAAGMRSPGDIDLLVAEPHVARAREILAGMGYRMAPGERMPGGRRDLHVVFEPEPGHEVPPVELHWRLHWRDRGFGRHLLTTSSVGRAQVRELGPTGLVQATLLFYARDGFAGLRLGADAAAALERSPLPPAALVQAVEPGLRPHLAAAVEVTTRLFGGRGEVPRLDRRRRAATRLANWPLAGEVPQMHANVVLVDLLLGPARAWLGTLAALRDVPGVGGAAHSVKTLVRLPAAAWTIRSGRQWADPA